MSRARLALGIVWFVLLVNAFATDYPPADHGGGDLTLANGDRIWGAHTNLGHFTIPGSATVTVRPYGSGVAGSGLVQVHANDVVVAGVLDASGAGHAGGGGSGGGGGSAAAYFGGGGGLGANGGAAARDGQAGAKGSNGAVGVNLPGGAGAAGGAGGGAYAGVGGTGGAGAAKASGGAGVAGADGGYLGLCVNGDFSSDESVTMGSGAGGGGGGTGGGSDSFSYGGGGGGGGAGGAGGGCVMLFAATSMNLTGGTIRTAGALGGAGQAGLPGHTDDGYNHAYGGDGGLGGAAEPAGSGTGGAGGAGMAIVGGARNGGAGAKGGKGAGGSILLKCDSAGRMNLSNANFDARGGNGLSTNGGTIKIFYVQSKTGSYIAYGGRVYTHGANLPHVLVDKNAPGPTRNGQSWATAYATVQAGINAAPAANDGVWVADGTYGEGVTLKAGVTLYGGFTGYGGLEETALDQRDWVKNETILDGSHALSGEPINNVVTLETTGVSGVDGLTITGGHARGAMSVVSFGGGIYCYDVDPSCQIRHCRIIGNKADMWGGGVYCQSASPLIADCEIVGNSATNPPNSPTGGGIGIFFGAPTLLRCVIANNHALSEGGISASLATPRFLQCWISGNLADGEAGGGTIMSSGMGTQMVNCIVSGNRSVQAKGGIYHSNALALYQNCGFADNSAGSLCGGLYMDIPGATISNCTFTSNTQCAIYEATGSDPTVANCLFFGNPDTDYKMQSGATYKGASQINAIPDGKATSNVDGDPRFRMDQAGLTHSGHWTAAPTYSATTARTTFTDANANLTVDALKGQFINPNTGQSMQAYVLHNTATTIEAAGDWWTARVASGDTWREIDYHLLSTSGAIDLGRAAGAPTTDMDGVTRPVDFIGRGADHTGTEYDIGAYEYPYSYNAARAWTVYE
ncbi:MAG: right-handed parallel beta-helix repeat-containing protein [Candidatus Sumerlaeota bacterium]|nr:right-handed parallel beta-helix repeat-containing protein [Candidatus Sumerlaeota bacterium]